MLNIDFFWSEFLKETGRDNSIRYSSCFHFELTKELANFLLELVLSGTKRATASSLLAYQISGEKLPEVGDLSIVTDWDGNPRCVIETTDITILPYKDITYDICKREGEDDTLESWQEGHIRFYKEEGKELGYEFSEDLMVVFEDFKVVYTG
jgi:uncharacterized protein YhfF